VTHPIHVSPLAGWAAPSPAGYDFLVPFGCWLALLGSSSSHWGFLPFLRPA